MSPVFLETLRQANSRLDAISAQLSPIRLASKVGDRKTALGILSQRADSASRTLIDSRNRSLKICMAKLDALSPLKVLDRGFAIVENESGEIVSQASDVGVGESLKLTLSKGRLKAKVTAIESDPES